MNLSHVCWHLILFLAIISLSLGAGKNKSGLREIERPSKIEPNQFKTLGSGLLKRDLMSVNEGYEKDNRSRKARRTMGANQDDERDVRRRKAKMADITIRRTKMGAIEDEEKDARPNKAKMTGFSKRRTIGAIEGDEKYVKHHKAKMTGLSRPNRITGDNRSRKARKTMGANQDDERDVRRHKAKRTGLSKRRTISTIEDDKKYAKSHKAKMTGFSNRRTIGTIEDEEDFKPHKAKMTGFSNRRTIGAIEDEEKDITECEMTRSKNSPPANSQDILLGSKGAVAALASGEKNKTLICMMKAFEIMKGQNGVILRKTSTGLTMVTNDEVNLDNMLSGKSGSQALHIGVAGQSSLREGSRDDESTADLNAKDNGVGASFKSNTRNKDGGIETSGSASGSMAISKTGRKRLQMNSEEETSFDNNKRSHAQNDELGSMKHSKKTEFDFEI